MPLLDSCWGASIFTHHCFCITNAGINGAEKPNSILSITWKWFWPSRTPERVLRMPGGLPSCHAAWDAAVERQSPSPSCSRYFYLLGSSFLVCKIIAFVHSCMCLFVQQIFINCYVHHLCEALGNPAKKRQTKSLNSFHSLDGTKTVPMHVCVCVCVCVCVHLFR